MKKVKGFTMIEALIALTISGVVAMGATKLKLDDLKLDNSKAYAKDMNDLMNAVDQRLSIDGYDVWDKNDWSSAEITKLVNNQLQGTASSCGNGTWTPKNGDTDIKLVNCSMLEKKPYDMNVKAELIQDSFGFVEQFKLRYTFQNTKDFEDDFLNFKNAFRTAKVNQKNNVTGTTTYNLINTLSDTEINTKECISLKTDCSFDVVLNRQGGSEYIRANGENSMIDATLSFIDTKGNAPLKCLRWSKDETNAWTKEVNEECGIGIYKNGTRLVVDVAGDTGTYSNILLDKECNKYKWDGSNVVTDGVSPCGIINNGTEIYQVVENINSTKITAETGELKKLIVNELVAKTISAEYIEATTEIKTELLKTNTITTLSGNLLTINEHLKINKNLSLYGTSIYAPNAYLTAKNGRFIKDLRVDKNLSLYGTSIYAPNASLNAKNVILSKNLEVNGNEIKALNTDILAKNITLSGNIKTKNFSVDDNVFIRNRKILGSSCNPNLTSLSKDNSGKVIYCDRLSYKWKAQSSEIASKAGVYSLSGLVPGRKYLVSVYGTTKNRGTGNQTLNGIKIYKSGGVFLLASTPDILINWHDGSAPQSATLLITAPSNGSIYGKTDSGLAKKITAIQLN